VSRGSAQGLRQERFDRVRTLGRRAHVRAVADVLDHVQLAVRKMAVQVIADRARRNDIVAALQDQGRYRRFRHVGPVVGQEGGAREVLGDVRIVAAEAGGQLLAQFRLVGRAHDGRRQVAGPAEVVRLHRLEQFVDVRAREAAEVVLVVDIAGGGTHHDLGGEALRRLDRGQQPDHGADGVADEDHRPVRALVQEFDHVVGIAVQRLVFVVVIRAQVRTAAADQVERDRAETLRECRGQEAPHRLVASEPVREDHRCRAGASDTYVVTDSHRHCFSYQQVKMATSYYIGDKTGNPHGLRGGQFAELGWL
jgi:hypothetical protein